MSLDQVRRALAGYTPRQIEAPEARPAAVALVLIERAGLEGLFIKRAARAGAPGRIPPSARPS